jgi:hypothetical protein
MRTILAIGVSAAALMAVSSVASAQSDCVNGWHMIKDNIPVRCDVIPSAFSGPGLQAEPGTIVEDEVGPVVLTEPTPIAEEPLYTGSIAPLNESEQPPRPGGPAEFEMVASQDECRPGAHWMMELNSGNRPVACDEAPVVTGAIESEAPAPVLVEEEPLVTGSINTTDAGQGRGNAEEIPSAGEMQFVASQDECQPGHFWMMELNSGNRPVACE